MALTQLEMVLRGDANLRSKSTQRHHQESEGEHASGNREALTHTSDNGGKQSGGTGPGGRDHNGHGVVKSEGFFPFFDSGFRTHVVATTVCATGGVHTLRVARTFF